MSTPVVHNIIFAKAVRNSLYEYNRRFWKVSTDQIDEFFIYLMGKLPGYYNLPDAIQAIKRSDGSILSRRVSHFETAKDGASCNWYKAFSAFELLKISEDYIIPESNFSDTNDQAGRVIGRLSDFAEIDRSFGKLLVADKRDFIMVQCAMMHLKGVDYLNDLLFREFVSEKDDGTLVIGNKMFNNKVYGPEEKKEVFLQLKNAIMLTQELEAAVNFPRNAEEINEAIQSSYRYVYSPWLAENTLKYVKPIKPVNPYLDTLPTPIVNPYQEYGIERFYEEIHNFVKESIWITKIMFDQLLLPSFEATKARFDW